MATAVFGSANGAAPAPFRGRVKTKSVLGQSPLPKTMRIPTELRTAR